MDIVEARQRQVSDLLKAGQSVDQHFCLCAGIERVILQGAGLKRNRRVFGGAHFRWGAVRKPYLFVARFGIYLNDQALVIPIPVPIASSQRSQGSLLAPYNVKATHTI